MENIKKLIWFLNKESNNNDSIQPSWDGHRWITLIDLPSLGKFGLGASEDKMKSVEMAIDHAVLFVDEYLDKHPDIIALRLADVMAFHVIDEPVTEPYTDAQRNNPRRDRAERDVGEQSRT